jgi:hypothetical protein
MQAAHAWPAPVYPAACGADAAVDPGGVPRLGAPSPIGLRFLQNQSVPDRSVQSLADDEHGRGTRRVLSACGTVGTSGDLGY